MIFLTEMKTLTTVKKENLIKMAQMMKKKTTINQKDKREVMKTRIQTE